MRGGSTRRWPAVRWLVVALVAAAVAVAACSGPDTSAGADLFAEPSLGGLRGCQTCHTVTDRPSVGGPSLLGVGSSAGERVAGLGAEDYLRQSIVAPGAWFVDGWGEGMPAYGEVLDDDQLDALVAYLLSLR